MEEREADDESEEIDNMIELIQQSLFGDNPKPSVADLTRLFELRRELAHFDAESLTVRWIDAWPQIPDCEE